MCPTYLWEKKNRKKKKKKRRGCYIVNRLPVDAQRKMTKVSGFVFEGIKSQGPYAAWQAERAYQKSTSKVRWTPYSFKLVPSLEKRKLGYVSQIFNEFFM